MVIVQVFQRLYLWPFLLHGLSSEKFHENPNDAIIVARRAHVGVLLVRRRVAKGIQVIPEDFGKANPA